LNKCSIIIREFKLEDLDDILIIEEECFPSGERYSREIFLYYYLYVPDLFLVAEYCGRVVGYIIADYSRDTGHIVSIAVHPKFRGRGFGKRLMIEAEKRLIAKGVKEIILEVEVTNSIAIKMYEKLGYKIVRILPGYYNGRDAYLMMKIIRKN
jgi:ribosomal-protein-alanine N-acetyltransferase